MDLLRKRYTPDTLPYHIIVPSLPGFALSSDPPLTHDWKLSDTARIMHNLMLSLGFIHTGYLVQGGDIGSLVCRCIAATYAECKGMHVNFMFHDGITAKFSPSDSLSAQEKNGLKRLNTFTKTGSAYAQMHGTKPSTTSLVLASSPLAHLIWISEKFLAWSDPRTTPSLHDIISGVALYWLTNCFPTSMYTYREVRELVYVSKPTGYSFFPYELAPVPRAWAEKTADVVWSREHDFGGHFAAVEVPRVLLGDVEEWVRSVWEAG